MDRRITRLVLNRWLRFTIAGLCCVAACAFVVAAGLPERAQTTASGYLPNGLPIAPEIGGVAPALGVQMLGGQPFTPALNKPLVINFWATWCGPCAFELPLLDSLQKQYPDVQFIAINMGEDVATVRAWLAEHPLALTVTLDPDQAAFRRYRVRGAPSTFFVDQNGVIRQIVYGALAPDGLESRLQSIRKD